MRILHLESDKYDLASLEKLSKNHDIAFKPFLSQEEYLQLLKDEVFDVIFTRLGLYTGSNEIDLQPSLKYIVTATTGLNHIDLNAAKKANIVIISLKGEYEFLSTITSTAEHTWALLLTLCRKISSIHSSVLSGKWERTPFPATELTGKVLGVIGYGRLGKMVARYGVAFGMKVLCYDIDPTINEKNNDISFVSFNDLLQQSDVVVLMASWEEKNRNIINEQTFSQMKKGAFFINTSRGEMVDEASLLIALKTGHLSGAGIDVLEGDSSWGTATPENQNLIEFSRSSPEKIIITSHTGGFAKESILKTRNFITEKFLNISSI